jgi:hypothetical protein
MEKNFPFRSLAEQIEFMRSNPAEVSNTYTTAGNKRTSKMTDEILRLILMRKPRNEIVIQFKKLWKEVSKKHPEIIDTSVRENIFWYLDAACDFVRYEQISMDEILK